MHELGQILYCLYGWSYLLVRGVQQVLHLPSHVDVEVKDLFFPGPQKHTVALVPCELILLKKGQILLQCCWVGLQLFLAEFSHPGPHCRFVLNRQRRCLIWSVTSTSIVQALLLPLNFLQESQLPWIRDLEESQIAYELKDVGL